MTIYGNSANEHSFRNDITNQTVNNPPNVKIEIPKEGTKLKANSSVRYRVVVTDKEDGSTEFGEILPNEVVLELTCWPSKKAATDYKNLTKDIAKEPTGLTVIKHAGCFNCHNDKARLTGPSFEDIAIRYKNDPTAIHTLAKNVITGSTGIWGDVQMPSNPELSKIEVIQAVEYILKQGNNQRSRIYNGYEGVIWPIKQAIDDNPCVYVLTTSYTDKGKGGVSGTELRAQHSILLN
ncbi:MAG: hypothetical protein DHS20C17_30940 [Cyclobacteriaceae bacterium]|nr:MAG: hypothetical protein DHS20C17_30940 [Cyclobacteriaceae bacterium]